MRSTKSTRCRCSSLQPTTRWRLQLPIIEMLLSTAVSPVQRVVDAVACRSHLRAALACARVRRMYQRRPRSFQRRLGDASIGPQVWVAEAPESTADAKGRGMSRAL
jgi:hypothetical protein